jgi:tetratricopeptide (TPR) repeat protein
VPEATYRITMLPELPLVRQVGVRSERWALILAAAAGVFLMLGTVAFPWWSALVGHGVADYHYWAGREAYRKGEAQIVVQRHWQQAIAADPGYTRVRLDLARSYIDGQWYGGAIAQAEAVLSRRRSKAETSLAYTYLGYCHYLLGRPEQGKLELEMAIQFDPENALAQSVVERLQRQGKLPPLDVKPAS